MGQIQEEAAEIERECAGRADALGQVMQCLGALHPGGVMTAQ